MAPNLFILASVLSLFGTTLTSIASTSLAAQIGGTEGAIAIIVAFYCAIGLGGLFSSMVGNYLNTYHTVLAAEAIRTIGLAGIMMGEVASIPILVTLTFFLGLFEGLFHASKYALVRHVFGDMTRRNRFLARVQSYDAVSSILAPIAAGLLVGHIDLKSILFADMLTYVLSLAYFAAAFRSLRNQPVMPTNLTAGYRVILKSRPIRDLNLARVLNNVLYALWNVSIPIFVLGLGSKEAFGRNFGVLSGAIAISLLLVNQILPRITDGIKTERAFVRFGFIGSLTCLAFIGGMYIQPNWWLAVLGALAMGVSTAGYRTGVIMIGQRVTPPNVIHLVIASGDSVSRLASASTGYLMGLVLTGTNLSAFGLLATTALAIVLGFKLIVRSSGNVDSMA